MNQSPQESLRPKPVELKPCPFCGCDEIDYIPIKFRRYDGCEDKLYGATCTRCHVESMAFHTTIDATEAWNKRVPLPQAEKLEQDSLAMCQNENYRIEKRLMQVESQLSESKRESDLWKQIGEGYGKELEESRREVAEQRKTIECIEHEVAKVYCYFTNNKFSKPNTIAQHVIEAMEEYNDALYGHAIKSLTAKLEKAKEVLKDLLEAGMLDDVFESEAYVRAEDFLSSLSQPQEEVKPIAFEEAKAQVDNHTEISILRDQVARLKEENEILVKNKTQYETSLQFSLNDFKDKCRELTQERDQLRKENEELQATFDLSHHAQMRAVEEWRKQDPEGRRLKMPDMKDHTLWLITELSEAKEELSQLRTKLAKADELIEIADGELCVGNGCCSCHIQAPCSFCMDNNTTIEFKKLYKDYLALTPSSPDAPNTKSEEVSSKSVVESGYCPECGGTDFNDGTHPEEGYMVECRSCGYDMLQTTQDPDAPKKTITEEMIKLPSYPPTQEDKEISPTEDVNYWLEEAQKCQSGHMTCMKLAQKIVAAMKKGDR